MFWLIMTILFFVFCIFCILRKKMETEIAVSSFSISMIFFMIFITILISGITDYPYIKGKKSEITALSNRIKDIRGASYKYIPGKNNIISGSIENFKQSTILSEYITRLAEKESKYSKKITEMKTKMDLSIFWWFGTSAFMSDKILEIE